MPHLAIGIRFININIEEKTTENNQEEDEREAIGARGRVSPTAQLIASSKISGPAKTVM